MGGHTPKQNQNEMYKLSKVKNGHKYAANNKQYYRIFSNNSNDFL